MEGTVPAAGTPTAGPNPGDSITPEGGRRSHCEAAGSSTADGDAFDLFKWYQEYLQCLDPYCQKVNALLTEMAHGKRPFPDTGLSLNAIRQARVMRPSKVMKLIGLMEDKRASLLVDGGAEMCFMDPSFARDLGLTPQPLPESEGTSVRLADGRRHPLLQYVNCFVQIDDYQDTLRFLLTPLVGMDAILGADWLEKYGVLADYKKRTVSFVGPTQRQHLLQPDVEYNTPAFLMSAAEVEAAWEAGEIERMVLVLPDVVLEAAQDAASLTSATVAGGTPPATPAPQPAAPPTSGLPGDDAAASLSATELQKVARMSRDELLAAYADRIVDSIPELPPDRGHFNFTIEEKPGSTPPKQQAYRLSARELEELRRQLAELRAKGFIRASSSSYGAPVLFVPKKGGDLRMCVDWRRLNSQTIKNAHPLPRIDESLDQTVGAKVFSKIDLANGYFQLRVAPEDIHKTAMNCGRYGLWEWVVMGFGLANAPAKFQTLLNHVITPEMARFCVVYLDDILVFSKNEEEHKQHVAQVLHRLRQFQLYAKRSKCEFFKPELEYLGHIVSADGIRPVHDKVKAVQAMMPPRTPTEIKQFLGMVGFYRRFVPHMSTVSKPLRDLEKKGAQFVWTPEHERAFRMLKGALVRAPVLRVFDPSLPAVVYCDASEYGTGACLMQDFGQGLQPVAYESRGYSQAEQNYPVHDKEMLAVVRALTVWRHYLREAKVTVFTDHHSLQYYHQKDVQFSQRQQRWAFFLQQFAELTLTYTPGKYNVVADALSRYPRWGTGDITPAQAEAAIASLQAVLVPTTEDDAIQVAAMAAVQQFELHLSTVVVSHTPDAFFAEVKALYGLDKAAASGLAYVRDGKAEKGGWKQWELHEDLLFFRRGEGHDLRLYVPASASLPPSSQSLRQRLIAEHHDAPISGHLGRNKTQEILSRRFFWHTLSKDVAAYVRSCDTCQRTKARNHPVLGLSQPLPVPQEPWEVVGMDFITQLPETQHGNTQILVFTDHKTKMVHFVPAPTPLSAEQVAAIYMRHVFRLHGYPTGIVSDRDKRFVSDFWRELQKLLGTKLHMSTAYHPQTDGQTERANRTLEEMVRAFVDEQHSNWDELLPAAEFAYNNSVHASTGFSPFYLNFGRHPHTPAALLSNTPLPSSQSPAADGFVHALRRALDTAHQRLEAAKQVQAAYANQSRKEHTFQVGDKVLLETKFVTMAQAGPARKFRHLYFGGPLRVVEVVSPTAVRLEGFPDKWKGHPVINVSRLRPYEDGAVMFPGRQTTDVPIADFDLDSDEPVFNRVLHFVASGREPGSRTRMLLVRWSDGRLDSWHPEAELREWCKEANGNSSRFMELRKLIK